MLRFSGVVFLSHLKEGEFVPNRIFLINKIPLFMRSLVVSFENAEELKCHSLAHRYFCLLRFHKAS